ncbi:MAG: amidohydrolase family protein [Woeseia sp.]
MAKPNVRAAFWISILVLPAPSSCNRAAEVFLAEYETVDILIENGAMLDGLGNEPIPADVVIVDDTIVFVGDAKFTEEDLQQRVTTRIDAAGKTVAPGFIDLHSHGDPFETPAFENFLAMGVTTIALGQDGSSPEVATLSEWLDKVSEQGIGVNLAMFVGHGTLRNLSGIGLETEPAPEDLDRMLAMLDETLDYSFGLSTGLEYNPGLNAKTSELRALAEVVGQHGRIVMSHLRNEDDDQLEKSIAELLEQGEHARVHISHLKSVYGKGAERADEILAILDSARDSGIDITADVYPYTASYTGIGIVFPVWSKTAEQFAVARRDRRDELAAYLRERVEKRNGPEATLLGTAPYTGKTLADLSFEQEMPFEDVLIDVIGPQGASGAYFVMNDELQTRLLQRPYVGVCSDGSPTGFHPRGHGTFARIIEEYVVEQGALSLQEAVRKMTSFPAKLLRIDDRGILGAGKKADIIVFDPANVRALATYPEPLQLSEGFDAVIVNGRIARQNDRLGETFNGRVLVPAEAEDQTSEPITR